ncbi:hypothetical protein [Nocardia sp. NPDC060249]|uniref:hypothetical protein n=1 Tax=Nocardia sp. NPDC060249 TaxID=3347082 RepID=UPI00365AAA34
MSMLAKQVIGAVGSVAVAGTVNVATSILTESRTVGWIAFVVALLMACVAVQFWLGLLGRSASSAMVVEDVIVDGSINARMTNPGVQRVSGAIVGRDLNLEQNGN